jgi:WD40 repeat protein
VVVACDDSIIYAYDLKTGQETHKFCGHTSAVTVVQPTIKKNDKKEVVTGEFILCSGSLDEMLCFFDSEVKTF